MNVEQIREMAAELRKTSVVPCDGEYVFPLEIAAKKADAQKVFKELMYVMHLIGGFPPQMVLAVRGGVPRNYNKSFSELPSEERRALEKREFDLWELRKVMRSKIAAQEAEADGYA